MRGHRCKRWGKRKEDCVFNTVSWHDQDQLDEGDTWDDLDPEYDPLKTTVPAWTTMGAAVYKSLLDSYGPQPLPAFDPGYAPSSARLFNAAVGLAEIGVVRQLQPPGPTPSDIYRSPESPFNKGPGWVAPPKGIGPKKSYQQFWEYGETMVFMVGTAAALAVAGIIGGGPKGRGGGKLGRSALSGGGGIIGHFNMQAKFGFMYSVNPLRSLTTDVYSQLASGYVPSGLDVIKERESEDLAQTGEFGVGSAFAHGLTGYI